MKKYIALGMTFMVLAACSTKKNAFVNRTYQSFTSYYNALFSGKEALKTELETKKKEHRDDFYGGYIQVFTKDALIGMTLEDPNISKMAASFFGNQGGQSQQITENAYQKAEEKALKVIGNNSMIFNGVERNKEIFNAYILLAESRMYQGKLFEALDALGQIYFTMPKDKRLPLAKIYEGLIYTKLKNYVKAEDIFMSIDRESGLKKEYQKLLNVYYAEALLYSNRKEEAIERLEKAMVLNKNRETRSRIAFLRGQILAELGKKEEARESFVAAYQYSNNFEFEVKSQIEIAKTFGKEDNYEEAKNYLEKISKKGIYLDRKNEFYYALGIIANNAGKKEEARDFFQKSIREKASDNNIRGLAYYELGKTYFQEENYIKSGAYYDSALAVMDYQPMKEQIQELSSHIKNISKNYYIVKKNDSILALTKMTEPQRQEYFQKHINELKEKEAKEIALQEKNKKSRKNESNAVFSDIDFPGFSNPFAAKKSNKFYFSNVEAMARGKQEFKQIWGNRNLGDNWRYSKNDAISLEEVENKILDRNTTADSRRFDIAYYTEKIPTDKAEILNLKKDRDTASLGLGRMYESYFQNTKLATKTLYDLVDNQPEDEVKLQALYSIFSMNFEKNPSVAERAKELILRDFPYTPYAEFVKNPRRTNFTKIDEGVKELYQKAYGLYAEEKYEEAKNVAMEAIEKYPKDALIPKLELLNAFITGKTAGKEIMLLQLQQIVFNYEKTPEGERAKEILGQLKSDLDSSGNVQSVRKEIKEEIKSVPKDEISTPPMIQQTEPKKEEKKQEVEILVDESGFEE